MRNLEIKLLALAGGLVFSTGAMAEPMTHAQREAAEDGIEATYKAAKKHCSALTGNAREVCVAEARGEESVAKAELVARNDPTAQNTQGVRTAKAEAKYSVAMERCEGKSGNDEDVCKKEAKAARVHALANAEAKAENSSADYAVAKEKCDAFSGDAKDLCIGEAKARYAQH
jgi:hypothetical protein